jgi:centriolar protein POC1
MMSESTPKVYADPIVLKALKGHKELVTQAIFKPESSDPSVLRQVISCSTDGLILAHSLRPNARPNKFAGHDGAVNDVSINPQGTLIASAGRDCAVRIWNNNASAKSTIMKGHSAPVKSIEFNRDGSLLVSAGDDKMVKIWDVAKKKFTLTFKGHDNWVRSAQFSIDSRMVASGSDDKTVKLWDVQYESEIASFTDHTGMVSCVNYHPDGTCLASCGSDRKIKIFDCRSKRLLQHYDAHEKEVNSVSFHSNGSYLVSSSNDSTIKVWDLRKGQILYTIFGHEGPTTSAVFSPHGDFILTGGSDTNIVIWSSNLSPKPVESLRDCKDPAVGTEIFITDKPNIHKLPMEKPAKMQRPGQKENKQLNKDNNFGLSQPPTGRAPKPVAPKADLVQVMRKEALGPCYKMLKPEVKETLDKIVYQLDLCRNTIGLLEQRITSNEDKLHGVMDYFKTEDLNYVSIAVII